MSARTRTYVEVVGHRVIRVLTEAEAAAAEDRLAHSELVTTKPRVRALRTTGRVTGRVVRVGAKAAALGVVYTGIGLWRGGSWLFTTHRGRVALATLAVLGVVAGVAVAIAALVAWVAANLGLVLTGLAGVVILARLLFGGGGTFEFHGTGTWKAR